jgi:hypothetical protein
VILGIVPVFLHEPITSAIDVLQLVRDRVPENLHLDYKAAWSGAKPEQQEEAGKDVAAFANAEGGDVIVGITEDPPKLPSGFFTRHKPPDGAQVRSWLHNVVVPRDVVTAVRIHPFVVKDGSEYHQVLVLSVPPWSDGIVGVRTTKKGGSVNGRTMNDRVSFLFPFRDTDETRFREFDEVLMALNVANRRTYVRLLDLLRNAEKPPVRIASLVCEALGHGISPVTGGANGELERLDSDVVAVKMTCTWSVVRRASALEQARAIMQIRMMNTGLPASEYDVLSAAADIDPDEAEILSQEFATHLRHLSDDPIIVIPLSQIEDAWLSAGVLNLLLKASLLLTRSGWCLTTG